MSLVWCCCVCMSVVPCTDDEMRPTGMKTAKCVHWDTDQQHMDAKDGKRAKERRGEKDETERIKDTGYTSMWFLAKVRQQNEEDTCMAYNQKLRDDGGGFHRLTIRHEHNKVTKQQNQRNKGLESTRSRSRSSRGRGGRRSRG